MKKSAKQSAFRRPEPPEVVAYLKTLGLGFDEAAAVAQEFWDYYETRGWQVSQGKTLAPMRNWKSAARGWKNRRNQHETRTNSSKNGNGRNTGTFNERAADRYADI